MTDILQQLDDLNELLRERLAVVEVLGHGPHERDRRAFEDRDLLPQKLLSE